MLGSLLLVFLSADPMPLISGDHQRSLEVDGRTRNYLVHVPPESQRPKEADKPTKWPVVLVFHGGGSNAQQMVEFSGMNETADKHVFVVDTYTHRVLKRHGWVDYEADYHEIQQHFQSSLEADVALYNEYHALLVRVGHVHCRKTPKCDECPLVDVLPAGGIRQPPSE